MWNLRCHRGGGILTLCCNWRESVQCTARNRCTTLPLTVLCGIRGPRARKLVCLTLFHPKTACKYLWRGHIELLVDLAVASALSFCLFHWLLSITNLTPRYPTWLHALGHGKSAMISIIFIGIFGKDKQVFSRRNSCFFCTVALHCQAITWYGKLIIASAVTFELLISIPSFFNILIVYGDYQSTCPHPKGSHHYWNLPIVHCL